MFATSLPCNIGLGLVGRARRARRLDDYGMYANQETRNSGSLRECPQSVDEDSAALIRSAAWYSSLIRGRAKATKAKHAIDFVEAQALWKSKHVILGAKDALERRYMVIGTIGQQPIVERGFGLLV